MTTLKYANARSHVDDAEMMTRIIHAASMIESARADPELLCAAKDELDRLVLAAHDTGMTWQTLGEALGVARGTAYQRHRRRPSRQTATDQPVSELD